MKAIQKKITIVLIAVFCMAYLVGCQINKTNISPVDQSNQEVEVVVPDEIPTEENAKLEELAIHYEENSLHLSEFVNDEIIADLFGEATEKNTHTYTEADNMDQHIGKTIYEYKFSGMSIKTINTLEEVDKFYVYQIDFSNPIYTTPRQIKVGDSLDMLREKYPEAIQVVDSNRGNYYLFRPINHFDAMGFTILNNEIGNIHIYTLLEE